MPRQLPAHTLPSRFFFRIRFACDFDIPLSPSCSASEGLAASECAGCCAAEADVLSAMDIAVILWDRAAVPCLQASGGFSKTSPSLLPAQASL